MSVIALTLASCGTKTTNETVGTTADTTVVEADTVAVDTLAVDSVVVAE